MAHVGEEQHLLARAPGDGEVPVGERPGREGTADLDAVATVDQRRTLARTQAETPAALVVARAIGNPLGPVGAHVQAGRELLERQGRVYRLRVADDVQIVRLEVDDAPA